MSATTYEGFVEGGRILLAEGVQLPEQTRVYVVVPDATPTATGRIMSPRLARPEQAGDFALVVIPEPGNGSV